MLTSRGVNWQEVSDLREVAADVDVLYQTRIQKERFTNLDDYAKVRAVTWGGEGWDACIIPCTVN